MIRHLFSVTCVHSENSSRQATCICDLYKGVVTWALFLKNFQNIDRDSNEMTAKGLMRGKCIDIRTFKGKSDSHGQGWKERLYWKVRFEPPLDRKCGHVWKSISIDIDTPGYPLKPICAIPDIILLFIASEALSNRREQKGEHEILRHRSGYVWRWHN